MKEENLKRMVDFFIKSIQKTLSSGVTFYYAELDENLEYDKTNPRYLISEFGNAFDVECGEFIEPKLSGDYLYWMLGGRQVFVHQIIAELFVKKPKSSQPLVPDHKDGCKTNNIASNLEWKTQSENLRSQDVQERKARSLKRTNNMKEVASVNETLNKVIKKQEELISELEVENAKLKYELKNLSERYSDEIANEVQRLKGEKESMHEIIKLYERKINRLERNIEREVERERETNILREEYRKYFGIV